MASHLPSKAWSCETLQRGLTLVRNMPLNVDSLQDPDVKAMEEELERLMVGVG